MEMDVDWEGKMKTVAKLITSFSGREISKLVLAWQVSNLRESTPLKGTSNQGQSRRLLLSVSFNERVLFTGHHMQILSQNTALLMLTFLIHCPPAPL